MSDKELLRVENLEIRYETDDGIFYALNGVSLHVDAGETLGLVGETGAGKTTLAKGILRLIPSPPGKIAGGKILYDGKDLLSLSETEMHKIRGNAISMVFQDPMTSLNPYLRISTQMIETIRLHQDVTKQEARAKAIRMLQLVGIPSAESRIDCYPHQFSGGMRQRVMIAMALSCNADLLIADEPTTALDVTIQAQILELIKKISQEMGTAVILITHDLGVVAGMCDKVCVMYAGRVVESANTDDLYENPMHPYTKGLIASVPKMDGSREERLFSIEGQPPNVIDLPPCCPFHPRCNRTCEVCTHAYPPVKKTGDDHYVACWLHCSEEEREEALKAARKGEN